MHNHGNQANIWRPGSLVAAVFVVLACDAAFAAVRVTEGAFDRCEYGNRGGMCIYRDESGNEQEIRLPPFSELALELEAILHHLQRDGVRWFIDGKGVSNELMDGGFLVPAHPAFQEDHFVGLAVWDHPFRGCQITVVEQPGRTEIYLDTNECVA